MTKNNSVYFSKLNKSENDFNMCNRCTYFFNVYPTDFFFLSVQGMQGMQGPAARPLDAYLGL